MSKILIDHTVLEQALEALESARVWKTLNLHKLTVPQLAVAATELRAALEHPQDHSEQHLDMVPAGWKLVPIEPTLGMSIAFGESFYTQDRCLDDDKISDWWGDMLAAAPQPPTVKESLTIRPQVEQEPVAWQGRDGYLYHFIEEPKPGDRPLYTHPQPSRQPLTDAEILMVLDAADIPDLPRDFEDVDIDIARAIEAAHGIGGEK